jgi:exodeoxyribonuclease III
MLRLTTANLNGIRSAASKGFFEWMRRSRSDVVCVQEVKAHLDDLDPRLRAPRGWHAAFHCAQKKGYSGVALFSRRAPDQVVEGLGIADIDCEGRFLRADFGAVSVVSLYLPSGSAGPHRQQAKFAFMAQFMPELIKLRRERREFILCGDWNIAHQAIDLKNWRSNQKNSGFLPEERAWLGELLEQRGWVDVFRTLDPRPEQYTWWSNRGESWAKNVGWRIDYQIATPGIARAARKAAIYKARRFSDHAPLTIDYDVAF